MKIGEKLKQLREIRGFSQADVAHKLGITRQAYAYYENADRQFSADTIFKLSKILDFSMDNFMDDEKYVDEFVLINALKKLGCIVTNKENIVYIEVRYYTHYLGFLDDEDMYKFSQLVSNDYANTDVKKILENIKQNDFSDDTLFSTKEDIDYPEHIASVFYEVPISEFIRLERSYLDKANCFIQKKLSSFETKLSSFETDFYHSGFIESKL